MIYAYLDFWRRAFDFAGRSERPDYWWAVFANMLIAVLSLIFLLMVGEEAAPLLSLIQIYGFFTIIPNLSQLLVISFYSSSSVNPQNTK